MTPGGPSEGSSDGSSDPEAKPTPADLGIDPAGLNWERSGDGDGSIEIAFPAAPSRCARAFGASGARGGGAWARGDWVLMRVAGDPAGRISVFDRNEWECFVDGVMNGEFDTAAADPQ